MRSVYNFNIPILISYMSRDKILSHDEVYYQDILIDKPTSSDSQFPSQEQVAKILQTLHDEHSQNLGYSGIWKKCFDTVTNAKEWPVLVESLTMTNIFVMIKNELGKDVRASLTVKLRKVYTVS